MSREVGQAQNNSSQVHQSQVGREGLNSNIQDNGINQLDGKSTEPWWQQKNARIAEIEDGGEMKAGAEPWWQQKNARTTEIENGDEMKTGPFGAQTSEQPVRRSWVPPQPPPVVMPEAAEAIRRPKQSIQKEQSDDEQYVSHPTDTADELQDITKISEAGGSVEING
ncbi:PEROXISOMAL MEMBRANE PROTEIN PEX14-LIKE [Salix viminalis]|uniref:PEROXISOMAL MEMBRANE PROTEIN PEX14-LIKE n=1 Tax=Salix viminalis TaxID=40686 RepID=A0A9Q0SGY9_SALVM|nr:PEROXISOMAL MEMBRANE PROTEIN PEX14-LIKE [Salix viminalis]